MKFGIANSISFDAGFDSIDTLKFVRNLNQIDFIQVYLNESHLNNDYFKQFYKYYSLYANKISIIYHISHSIEEIILYNQDEYLEKLRIYKQNIPSFAWVSHITMEYSINEYGEIIQKKLFNQINPLALELVFDGKTNPLLAVSRFKEFIIKRFKDLSLLPVIDIPRFFHRNLNWNMNTSESVVIDLISSFNKKNIPIIYHLIDITSTEQDRKHFAALGKGILPWLKLFPYIQKSHPDSVIVLEYEDKMQAINSLDYLAEIL